MPLCLLNQFSENMKIGFFKNMDTIQTAPKSIKNLKW